MIKCSASRSKVVVFVVDWETSQHTLRSVTHTSLSYAHQSLLRTPVSVTHTNFCYARYQEYSANDTAFCYAHVFPLKCTVIRDLVPLSRLDDTLQFIILITPYCHTRPISRWEWLICEHAMKVVSTAFMSFRHWIRLLFMSCSSHCSFNLQQFAKDWSRSSKDCPAELISSYLLFSFLSYHQSLIPE